MMDQIIGKKLLSKPRPVRVVCIAGGKGGVGKTNVAVNLAVSLGKRGHKVLLFDADLGLGNVNIMMGLEAKQDLANVISGECNFEDIIVNGPFGIKILPSSSADRCLLNLNKIQQMALVNAFSQIKDDLDFMIIDTASGMHESMVTFSKASQSIILVVSNEPTAIVDSYITMRYMLKENDTTRFYIVPSQTRDILDRDLIIHELENLTKSMDAVTLEFLTEIPYDLNVITAIKKNRPVTLYNSHCAATRAFIHMAKQIERWPLPQRISGDTEFFLERLIQGSLMEQRI